MMWVALLRKFWPVLAVLGALLGAWLWHAKEVRKAVINERQRVTVLYQAAMQVEMREREKIREGVNREWERKVESLNRRSLSIDPGVIRLYVNAPSVPFSEPTGESASPASGGGSDLPVGPDIGRAALVLATECERDREKLISLQDWARKQAAL